jgi:hypothetical protein
MCYQTSNLIKSFTQLPLLAAFLLFIATGISMAQQSLDHELASIINQEKKAESIEVLVVGVFHFTQAPSYNAIDEPEQQKEIKILTESLARFNPSKIVLEYQPKEQSHFDSLYQAYRKGRHKLSVNERQQLGFRLAGQLNHERVYGIDYKKPWGMDAVMKWARQNQPEFVNYVEQWRSKHAELDSVMHHQYSIAEILSFMATEPFLNRLQEVRMRTLEVGAGENYIGLEPVSSVYKRNTRIFANLMKTAEAGDRILLIYGAGHSYFFNEFIDQHPKTRLADPQKYLTQ